MKYLFIQYIQYKYNSILKEYKHEPRTGKNTFKSHVNNGPIKDR
jgi:hypothetical protein